MSHRITIVVLSCAWLSVAEPTLAAEQTQTLAVQNMVCATCPYIVRQSLLAVDGVRQVQVSLEAGTATVVYDDSRVEPAALVAATTGAGFPAALQAAPVVPE